MKFFSACLACVLVFSITKIGYSERKKMEIGGKDISELVKIWKQAVKGLSVMQKFTSKKAKDMGEAFPDDMKGELRVFLKILYLMNRKMSQALDDFFRNVSASAEESHELQQFRQSLKKSIEQVYTQIEDVTRNIGMPIMDPSSLESMEKRMETLHGRALGLTLLLRNSGYSFDRRFFEMMAKVIKKNSL